MKCYSIIVMFLLTMFISVSCSDTTGTMDNKSITSDLTVLVKDTAGIPINGIEIETDPATITQITDQNGMAIFKDIDSGNYRVSAKRNSIEIFNQPVILNDKPEFVTFIIAVNVTVNLTITDALGAPLEGITVSTTPSTTTITTDENGQSILEKIPVRPYTFIISRGKSLAYINNTIITVRNGDVQDLELIVESQNPQVSITNIPHNMVHSIYDLTFEATGYDFEDGILPPEALQWDSDIDGFLGNGNILHVDNMSVGHHLITVTGTDSDQLKHKSIRQIALYFFSDDSYFPIPQEGKWIYENIPNQIQVKNERGEVEAFQFMNTESAMTDVNVRTSTNIYYNGGNDWYQYTVTDYYDNDEDAFFVTKTIETINSWDGEPDNRSPKNTVTITTLYNDKYPLFSNHYDLSENSEIVFATVADVDWLFEGISYGSQHYIERMDIQSRTTFEGYETIQTIEGTFETAKLRISQGDTNRYWWLAKGYGIVQYSYNTFDSPITASLIETNVDEISSVEQNAEKSLADWSDSYSQQTYTSDIYQTSDSIPPDIRQLVQLFRTTTPR